jgi:hypothetical protein
MVGRFAAAFSFAAVLVAATAVAGNFTLSPSIVARFDEEFNPLPFDQAPSGAGIYQVDFNYLVTDLAADERGFASTAFNITLLDGFEDVLGWQAEPTSLELSTTSSLCPGCAKYCVNLDAGIPGDLHGILASIPAGQLAADDPRARLGQTAPERLGSVFVRWDGESPGGIWIDNLQYSMANNAGYFLDVQSAAAVSVNFLEPGVPLPALPPPPAPIPEPTPVPPSIAPSSPQPEPLPTPEVPIGPPEGTPPEETSNEDLSEAESAPVLPPEIPWTEIITIEPWPVRVPVEFVEWQAWMLYNDWPAYELDPILYTDVEAWPTSDETMLLGLVDIDGDETFTGNELRNWRLPSILTTYGRQIAIQSSVPEPSGLLMLAIAAATGCFVRRTNRGC